MLNFVYGIPHTSVVSTFDICAYASKVIFASVLYNQTMNRWTWKFCIDLLRNESKSQQLEHCIYAFNISKSMLHKHQKFIWKLQVVIWSCTWRMFCAEIVEWKFYFFSHIWFPCVMI